MRLITWNVARRGSRLVEQATALATREPDVVALQEVTWRTLPLWQRAFELLGLGHALCSLDDAQAVRGSSRPLTGVMLASRTPLRGVRHALDMPRPESAVGGGVETADGLVEVYCVHVPNAANGIVKVESLKAIRRNLAAADPAARVLCGDLNTPRRELLNGEVISFARDSRGRLRPERGPEWDEAELGIVPGLQDLGYRDAYRALHGYGTSEPSWTWRRIAGHDGGWRIDHVFASPELRPIASLYHHAWRDQELSDHSALEADLEWSVATPASGSDRVPRRV